MNPTGRDVHVDAPMTNVSVAWKNESFVADKLFPEIKVEKESNIYFQYGRENLRLYNLDRAPGTAGTHIDFKIKQSDPYFCKERSARLQIWDELKDADSPIKMESDTTEMGTDVVLLDIEKKVADKATSYANYGDGTGAGNSAHYQSLGVDAKWSNYENSNPLLQVSILRRVIKSSCLRKPNTMIISDDVFEVLCEHPLLIERIKYSTQAGIIAEDALAKLFKVDKLYVAGCGYITTDEGQTEALGDVWSKTVILAYSPPSPGLKQISFGYLFRQNGWRMVEKWRDAEKRSDWIRVNDKFDIKIIDPYAGYLLADVIA